ncbi:MAG: SCO family protein [Flavobacteriales bacterium]
MANNENKGGIMKILMFVGILLVASLILMPMFERETTLKIYSPADINKELVDESMQNQKGSHTVRDFSLTNQANNIVNKSTFDGKIKIVDFFFTTCGNICPKMTFQMERINEKLKADSNFVIISHSVTPDIDTPEILAKYAIEHNATLPKWHFLTGEKSKINDLARKSYFAAKKDWDGDLGDFIHTENFVLVDKDWQIRGYYDGTSTEDVNRLLKEYDILLKEHLKK